MLTEQVDALESVKKKKLPFADRMGLLGMLAELTGDQLPMLASLEDSDKAAELQVEDILTAALHSALQYGADCVQRAGGAGPSTNKMQQDSEQEALMTMKLLDTLAQSCINEQPHARRAFLAHAKQLMEWLKTVGLNANRSPPARQAALSVLSNLIEADPALLSPPANVEDGGNAAAADTSSTTVPSSSATLQLSAAERAALLSSLLDAAFALCSSQEELSVETGHFSSHNLGTALLDVTAYSRTRTAWHARNSLSLSCCLRRSHCSTAPARVSTCVLCAVPVLQCDSVCCCGFCGAVPRLCCVGCVECGWWRGCAAGCSAVCGGATVHCADVLRRARAGTGPARVPLAVVYGGLRARGCLRVHRRAAAARAGCEGALRRRVAHSRPRSVVRPSAAAARQAQGGPPPDPAGNHHCRGRRGGHGRDEHHRCQLCGSLRSRGAHRSCSAAAAGAGEGRPGRSRREGHKAAMAAGGAPRRRYGRSRSAHRTHTRTAGEGEGGVLSLRTDAPACCAVW